MRMKFLQASAWRLPQCVVDHGSLEATHRLQVISGNTQVGSPRHPKCVRACSVASDSVPIDCSPPGSSVHGILQASILEWVAVSSSRGSARHRDRTPISCGSHTGRQILQH